MNVVNRRKSIVWKPCDDVRTEGLTHFLDHYEWQYIAQFQTRGKPKAPWLKLFDTALENSVRMSRLLFGEEGEATECSISWMPAVTGYAPGTTTLTLMLAMSPALADDLIRSSVLGAVNSVIAPMFRKVRVLRVCPATECRLIRSAPIQFVSTYVRHEVYAPSSKAAVTDPRIPTASAVPRSAPSIFDLFSDC
jgi:hypothetical protein